MSAARAAQHMAQQEPTCISTTMPKNAFEIGTAGSHGRQVEATIKDPRPATCRRRDISFIVREIGGRALECTRRYWEPAECANSHQDLRKRGIPKFFVRVPCFGSVLFMSLSLLPAGPGKQVWSNVRRFRGRAFAVFSGACACRKNLKQ